MIIPAYLLAKLIEQSGQREEAAKPLEGQELSRPLTPTEQRQLDVLQNSRRHAEMRQQQEHTNERGFEQ